MEKKNQINVFSSRIYTQPTHNFVHFTIVQQLAFPIAWREVYGRINREITVRASRASLKLQLFSFFNYYTEY
jgi:hypothetical protein